MSGTQLCEGITLCLLSKIYFVLFITRQEMSTKSVFSSHISILCPEFLEFRHDVTLMAQPSTIKSTCLCTSSVYASFLPFQTVHQTSVSVLTSTSLVTLQELDVFLYQIYLRNNLLITNWKWRCQLKKAKQKYYVIELQVKSLFVWFMFTFHTCRII